MNLTAQQLNEEALQIVKREGGIGQAVSFLSRALKLTKTAIVESAEENAQHFDIYPPSTQIGFAKATKSALKILQDRHDSPPFIFRRFLRFSTPDEAVVHNFVEQSYAILFNLALVFHLHGNTTGNDRYLTKALGLYKLANSLSVKEDLVLDPAFALATANNMGVIYAFLGDKD